MKFDVNQFEWTREHTSYAIAGNRMEIVTNPIPSCGGEHKIAYQNYGFQL